MKVNKVFKYLALVFDDVTNIRTKNKGNIDILAATMTPLELDAARSCIEAVFETIQEVEDYEADRVEEAFNYDPSTENH